MKRVDSESPLRHVDQMRRVVGPALPGGGDAVEEAGMAAHDDADIDAGQGAEIEIDADRKASATNAPAEMKPGVWSFSTRSLSMVFGAWTKAMRAAGRLGQDLQRAGGVVAADIDEGVGVEPSSAPSRITSQ